MWLEEAPPSRVEALEDMSEIRKFVMLTRSGALTEVSARIWRWGRLLASQLREVKARPRRPRKNCTACMMLCDVVYFGVL